jgi:flagellar P-ring protein FlgI
MMRILLAAIITLLVTSGAAALEGQQAGRFRLKDIGRIDGWRDNQLVGYGLVSGLAGSGDTSRNKATRQSLANALNQFDIPVLQDQVLSRNVAAVMVTATLPPISKIGDKLDVAVTSIGDARSLVGGVLLMTALKGPDGKVYALAQGALSVGGYRYDVNGNVVQKNHPTVGTVPNGANVEVPVSVQMSPTGDNRIKFVLNSPDFTTSSRVADAVNRSFGQGSAEPVDAGTVAVQFPGQGRNLVTLITQLENLVVAPDKISRVVINERTGTVVSGGDAYIDAVTVTHGDLKVTVTTDYLVSQPTFVVNRGGDVRTEVVPRTKVAVDEGGGGTVRTAVGGTVADLALSLNKMRVSPRDIISILQGIKTAGALHAELIIQ